MKVLLTGHDGYIGSVMMPVLQAAGHQVVGVDTFYYSDHHPKSMNNGRRVIDLDIRDLTPELLEGFDAFIHLAALSNDPLSQINPELTFAINHKASIQIGENGKGGRGSALSLCINVQRLWCCKSGRAGNGKDQA